MLTLADVIEGLNGPRLDALAGAAVSDVVVDSRQATRGSLFVAMLGERVDGHDFVSHAFGRGAVAAVVEHPVDRSALGDHTWIDLTLLERLIPGDADIRLPLVIRVTNALASLQRLSRFWRDRVGALNPSLRVIGITGSIGKTTSKELIAQVLAVRYRTLKSEGNSNNEIGVPLTLLRLTPEHERAVLEMGMYSRGEIALFASLAKPHVGVVTMVAPVHLERLGTIDNIQLAKAELVQALPPDGAAVLNDDDERVRAMASMTRARIVSYGLSSRADVWADEIESYGLEGVSFVMRHGEQSWHLRVPLLGRHSVHTALRAAAVGMVEGLSWEEVIMGLCAPTPQLRLAVVEGPFGSLVLDDTYNASEESTIAALNLLEEIDEEPRIAVLGDMLELGDTEIQAHRNVGCRAGVVAQVVICVGRRAQWMALEAVACGCPPENVHRCETNQEALRVLRQVIQRKSVILVKGSRGMKMEEIVTGLAAMANGAGLEAIE